MTYTLLFRRSSGSVFFCTKKVLKMTGKRPIPVILVCRDMYYTITMRYEYYNPNPKGLSIGDCAVRALAKALDLTWDKAYEKLVTYGYRMKNLPNADSVWGAVLHDAGFSRHVIPDSCPHCYTIGDFADDHPVGTYVLGTGSHAVTIIDNTVYDSWNSTSETPTFYWRLKK